MTPIRKGSNPVKIPFAIKSSDRTFAAWANEVREFARQIEARIPTANVGRGASAAGSKPPFWSTISRVPDSDPAEYQVTFSLGYLTYQNATAVEAEQGVTGYITPKINGVDMDDEDVEPLPLPGLASFVYLRVKTDADGAPKFDGESVTIEAFEEAQQSTHHVRPSPSGGEEEGDYYFLLLETESNGAIPTPAPRAKRRITGNRELPNQLVEIANTGDGREVYKGYSAGPDDKHEFRSLKQLEGRGEPIIKELDPGDSEADPPVPAEEEGDVIPFRLIAERVTQPQVRVTSDGDDIIQIEGNGYDDTYFDPFGGSIAFKDGMATAIAGGAFSGWWGTVIYQTGGGNPLGREDYQNGIKVASYFPSTGGTWVAIPGTEEAPGAHNISFP